MKITNKNPLLLKLMIIIIISLLLVAGFFTYHDYQTTKATYITDAPERDVVNDINDDLASNNLGLNWNIDNNHSRLLNNQYLSFDSERRPFFTNSQLIIIDIASDNKIIRAQIHRFTYDQLKKITTQLLEYLSDKNTINITFNYNSLTDTTIDTSELTYFAIEDQVLIDDDSTQIITGKLLNIYCPLIQVENHETNDDEYVFYSFIDLYEYYIDLLNNNYQKIDDQGFYKLKTPTNSPIEDALYYDENDESHSQAYSFCIQELSSDYGSYTSYKDDYVVENRPKETGYITWYQLDDLFKPYTFLNYLISHYYYFVFIIIVIGALYLILNSIINSNTRPKSIDDIPPADFPENLETIDIEKIINELIESSTNIINFKKIIIDYQAVPCFINGEYKEIVKIINDLYHFAIKHTNQNDTLLIKLDTHSLVFINDNFNISDQELLELKESMKPSKEYHFQFDHNCIKLIKTF